MNDVYIPVKVLVSAWNGYWVAVMGCYWITGTGLSRELAIEDLRRRLREEGRTE